MLGLNNAYNIGTKRENLGQLLGANSKGELPPDAKHLVSRDVIEQFHAVTLELDPIYADINQLLEAILGLFTIEKSIIFNRKD